MPVKDPVEILQEGTPKVRNKNHPKVNKAKPGKPREELKLERSKSQPLEEYSNDLKVSFSASLFASKARHQLAIMKMRISCNKTNKNIEDQIEKDKSTLNFIAHSDLPDPNYGKNEFAIGTPGLRQKAD